MPITWNPTLATGVNTVDDQHKELFRQVGELNAAMAQGRGRDEIAEVLDFLGQYVVRHFAHEERMMEHYACPAAEANRRAHAEFLAKFKTLQDRFCKGENGPAMVIEIYNTATNWLVQHIQGIDTKLRDCVQAGSQRAPQPVH